MPLYEYRCPSCGREYEALVTRSTDPAPACPGCGGGRAERRVSVFASLRSGSEPAPGPCGSSDCACRRPDD